VLGGFEFPPATKAEVDSGRTQGQLFHNPYVSIKGKTPERLDKCINIPFRKTRFSFTNEIRDIATNEITGFNPYNKNTCFADIELTDVKDELEIIVKEGVLKRWNLETEASIRYETINGKKVPVITPKCEVTLTNTVTGKEYMSDAEALADVQNPNTSTESGHIRRDVKVTVEEVPLGAATNIF